MKDKEDCHIWLSEKCHKCFSNINDSVKYYPQKRILYRPYLIQSPIANYYIKLKLDDGN